MRLRNHLLCKRWRTWKISSRLHWNEYTSLQSANFLKRGFLGASLRNIVKCAGVTTGAFYGYYDSKEKLFDALVSEQYEHVMDMYMSTQNSFKELEAEKQQANMGKIGGECLEQMIDYMYANEDEFRLILMCSKGTRYENMVHEMSEVEVQATHDFVEVMRENGIEVREIDPKLEHVLVSGMFTAFFELLIHKNDIGEAKTYLKQLREFYTAGWMRLFDMCDIQKKDV